MNIRFAPKSITAMVITLSIIASSVAQACSTPQEYVEMSRVRMSSNIESVFAVPGIANRSNVTARFENGQMIMMTIPSDSVAVGKRLVVEKVTHEDKIGKGDLRVHYDFVELPDD